QHRRFGRSPVKLIDDRISVCGGTANDAPRPFTGGVVQRSFNLVPRWLTRAGVLEQCDTPFQTLAPVVEGDVKRAHEACAWRAAAKNAEQRVAGLAGGKCVGRAEL